MSDIRFKNKLEGLGTILGIKSTKENKKKTDYYSDINFDRATIDRERERKDLERERTPTKKLSGFKDTNINTYTNSNNKKEGRIMKEIDYFS